MFDIFIWINLFFSGFRLLFTRIRILNCW